MGAKGKPFGGRNQQDYTDTELYQKCWTCGKACNGGCSWSADFVPVEGWTARPVTLLDSGEEIPTFEITDCPQYVYG